MFDPTEAEARIAITQLSECGQTLSIHMHGPVDERLGRRFRRRLERGREPQPPAEEQREHDDHRGDGGRVRQRVADHRIAFVDGFDRRLQRRCVRRRAGEDACTVGGGETEDGRDCSRHPGDYRDEGAGHADRRGPAAPQRREEGRTRGDTDGVGEQDEAELAEDVELHRVGQLVVDGAERQPDEERRGGAEGDAPNADHPEGGPDTDDDEDQQHHLIDEEVDHRALLSAPPTP